MNVPQEALDGMRATVEQIRTGAYSGRFALVGEGNKGRARDFLMQIADDAVLLANQLEQAGAARPGTLAPRPEIPLELLSTPAAKRYLAALIAAHEAALERDRELGYGEGGSAQIIEMLRVDVEQQVYGAVGSGRE